MFLWYVHVYTLVCEGGYTPLCVRAFVCVCTYLWGGLGVRTQVYFRYFLSFTCHLHF